MARHFFDFEPSLSLDRMVIRAELQAGLGAEDIWVIHKIPMLATRREIDFLRKTGQLQSVLRLSSTDD